MVSRIRFAALAGLVLLAGCGSGAPSASASDETGLTRERFIDIYVALRKAARDTAAAEDFAQRKRTILDDHGVDEEALRAFARSRGGDAQAMAEIWDTIQTLLTPRDSTEQAKSDATPADSTGTTPADSTATTTPDSAAAGRPHAPPGRAR